MALKDAQMNSEQFQSLAVLAMAMMPGRCCGGFGFGCWTEVVASLWVQAASTYFVGMPHICCKLWKC
jgi:hypothetical protein